MIALFVVTAFGVGDFCADLRASELKGTIAVGPPSCAAEQKDACGRAQEQLTACLKKSRNKVIEQAAMKAAIDEAVLTGTDITEIAGGFGARYVATAEVSSQAEVALVRIVTVEDGSVASAARMPLTSAPRADGPITYDTVDAAMGQLADRLAAALMKLDAHGKKRRVAVLKLAENGAISSKNGMGTLASAELVTRFRRDHDMFVVERSRLDQVMKEFELAQLGLVDEKTAPKLGKMLDAEAVVIGSVSDAGPEIRVHAQVVDVSTGVTLGADAVAMKSGSMVALASDAVVLRSKGGAVFRSALIPGWGQIYNRQPIKGGVIMGAVLGLGASAVVMQALNSVGANQYAALGPGANFDATVARVESYAIARTVLLSVMGAVWIYNIIDAYVNGVTFDAATTTGANGGGAFSF